MVRRVYKPRYTRNPEIDRSDIPGRTYGSEHDLELDAAGWIDKLESRFAKIEQAIHMPVGDMLGCGYYGCVFESEPPYVVKFTLDPYEGYVWRKIKDLVDSADPWEGLGVVYPKAVHRLADVDAHGDADANFNDNWAFRLWCVVREEADPEWTHTFWLALPVEQREKGTHMFASAVRQLASWPDAALEAMAQYPLADNLVSTLAMLREGGVVPRDLHAGNIGLAMHGLGKGQLVVMDPGGTPSDPVYIPRLAANPETGEGPREEIQWSRDPSWGLVPGMKFKVTKGSRDLGIAAHATGQVKDVKQAPGEREVRVTLWFPYPRKTPHTWTRDPITLYATHANRLNDAEVALLDARGRRVLLRKLV